MNYLYITKTTVSMFCEVHSSSSLLEMTVPFLPIGRSVLVAISMCSTLSEILTLLLPLQLGISILDGVLMCSTLSENAISRHLGLPGGWNIEFSMHMSDNQIMLT